jgi:purine-binding chemotaxis protein CheW
MAAETKATEKHTPVQERQGKYLTFVLGQEEYGISILKVREIIGILPITTVPQTPLII